MGTLWFGNYFSEVPGSVCGHPSGADKNRVVQHWASMISRWYKTSRLAWPGINALSLAFFSCLIAIVSVCFTLALNFHSGTQLMPNVLLTAIIKSPYDCITGSVEMSTAAQVVQYVGWYSTKQLCQYMDISHQHNRIYPSYPPCVPHAISKCSPEGWWRLSKQIYGLHGRGDGGECSLLHGQNFLLSTTHSFS